MNISIIDMHISL